MSRASPLSAAAAGPGQELPLAPTWFLDGDHPAVAEYAAGVCSGAQTPEERAVCLFYAVRDDIRYDPYRISADPAHLKASQVLAARAGFCVPKAVLLAACARAMGIPSRLGFADVMNHLSTAKLRAQMGSDLFVFHGYTLLWLDGRWVKATPTFNRSLCERFGVKTLDFDGFHDALLQPYDAQGSRHMEYVQDYGGFDDVPWERLLARWQAAYPKLYAAESLAGREEWSDPATGGP